MNRRSEYSEKSNDIDDLQRPRFKENTVEYMQKLKWMKKSIGYIYLQSSTEHITAINDKLLITSIVISAYRILIAIFIALQLERFISTPFFALVTRFKSPLDKRTFNNDVQEMPYREADILARNINILFSRMEKHIAQLRCSRARKCRAFT